MWDRYQQIRPVIKRITDVHVSVYAGNASFFLIISIFPGLMAFMTLLQYTGLEATNLVSLLENILPDSFLPLAESVINELYASSGGRVISLSVITMIWLASKGVMGLLNGLNAVYGVNETRGYIIKRLISMVYMVALLLTLLLTLLIHVFGQRVQAFLEGKLPILATVFSFAIYFRWIFLIAVLTFFFTSLFMALPNHRIKIRAALPGAAAAAVAWLIFSSAFSFYINNFSNYSYFYGSLTTLIVGMLWLYFCMNILFYGGMLNVVLDAWLQKRKVAKLAAQAEQAAETEETEEQAPPQTGRRKRKSRAPS